MNRNFIGVPRISVPRILRGAIQAVVATGKAPVTFVPLDCELPTQSLEERMTVLLQVGEGLGQTTKDTLTRKMHKCSLKHGDPFRALSDPGRSLWRFLGKVLDLKWLDDIYTIRKMSTSYTHINR